MPDPVAPATTNPAQTSDAPAAADAASTPDSGEPTWFDALTGRAPAEEAFAAGEELAGSDEEPTEGADAKGSDPDQPDEPTTPEPQSKPQKTEPGPDDVVRLTRTQLDRQIQAEVDRREAKRAREQAKRQQEQELERTAREDPYAFSEQFLSQREQEKALNEQTESVHSLIRTTAQQFDAAIVTPIVTSLPPDVQQRLLSEVQPVGVEGRSRLVTAALAEVRKAAIAEGRAAGEKAAEQRLRKNPAFRKELLAELRGSEDEPDLLPAGRRSRQPTDMDDWMRAGLATRAL